MADIIARLVLNSGSFDSKIKRATQGLLQMEQECRKAGKSMNDMEKDNRQFVQSLGSMQTVSTSVRGKIGELSGAFVELRSQYNRLTDEEKKGDFGRALNASLEQLKQRVAEAKRELSDITAELEGGGKKGGSSLFAGLGGKMSGALQVMAGNLMTKGVMAAVSFGSEMADMVKQGIELAKAGEGIRIAFERLGRGDILDGLREATHGTVTDLELMKAAVKFDDFKLPLDELGTMLAFAQQKAKDTGQSVDYMVDSIVTGLGRKSLMILDNLGLSANEVKEKMKETGDMTKAVGAIIREKMAKAGDYVETAADRATKADVELKNAMEDLGRTFQPLTDASNSLWNSIKVGALNALNSAVRPLIDALTEAGRMRAVYEGQSGDARVNRQLDRLKGIQSDRLRQDTYNAQLRNYDTQIASHEQYLKDYKAWQSDNTRVGAYDRMQAFQKQTGLKWVSDVQAYLDAFKKMRAEYVQGAKTILSPVKPVIDTSEAEQSITSLTKKLKDLQEQRKKAIAAGDTDLSKNLLKQINQTKADIKGLGGIVSTSTTHTATPQERAAEKVSEAERTYAETLQKNSIRLEAGLDSTLDNKKKELSAQERLFDAYNDAYATYKDPAYKESSKQAAEKIKQLAEEVKTLTDTQEASKKAARELESAQKKLADAQQKLADAQATGSATAVYKAQKDVDRQQGVVNRLQNPSLPVPAKPTGFEAYKQTIQAEIKFNQMQVDENTLHTLLQTALKNGLDGLTVDYSGLQERIAKGIDIPDSTWEALQEEINAKLKELGIEPIKIDFKTGEVSSDKSTKKGKKKGNPFIETDESGKETVNLSKAVNGMADGISKVVGGVEQLGIKIPDGLKNVLGGIQTVTTIISGIATTVLAIAAIASADAIIPFARGGIVGRAAGGLLIPGNSMSGDRLRMPVDGGRGMIGVNSGELILNRSQQDSIAAQLEGGMRNIELTSVVRGEDIVLAINNRSRRMWRGEFVTSKKL